jgi:enterochelin esterase family protein
LRFWETVRGRTPLVAPIAGDAARCRATFLWRAGEEVIRKVELRGGLVSVAPKPLRRLPGTDLWYRTEHLPTDARFVYRFAVTERREKPGEKDQPPESVTVLSFQTDPLNPRRFAGGSVAELADALPQTWAERQPGVPAGKLTEQKIQSRILKEERALTLYTPPDYSARASRACDLLLLFDGEAAQDLVPAPVLLDNLIARGKISPTVAVLVHSQRTRGRDLTCSTPFADFLAQELVPWVRANYRVSSDPSRVTISGISLGGLMAVYCGLKHSEVFGNVLSQSGSFWYYSGWPETPEDHATEQGWLARQFATSPRLPLRFYLEVGRFEGASMLPNNRRLRDVLEAKGYPLNYREFHGGHDYLTWRDSLADGLIALTGTPNAAPPR